MDYPPEWFAGLSRAYENGIKHGVILEAAKTQQKIKYSQSLTRRPAKSFYLAAVVVVVLGFIAGTIVNAWMVSTSDFHYPSQCQEYNTQEYNTVDFIRYSNCVICNPIMAYRPSYKHWYCPEHQKLNQIIQGEQDE